MSESRSSAEALRLSESLALPLDVVTMTQAILARKRSGKSYCAQKLAEQMLRAQQQIVAIDPTSAWYGLRSSADGNGPGFPVVVFGGDHADAPLNPRSGASLARAVVEHGFSAIFDVGDMDVEEQVIFGTDFCAALLKLNRNAMHLFMDEAHNWAPQNPVTRPEKHALSAVKRLVLQGGIRGIGFTMISQRTALLNKDVLSQVDLLTVLRMSHPLDIKAATDWISSEVSAAFAAEVKVALPSLPIGTAFISSAPLNLGKRIQIAPKETFNSGATPKPGERKVEPKVLAPIDIQKLGAQIADSVRESEANAPEALRRRIAELERSAESHSKEREQMLVQQIQEMETEIAGLRKFKERAMEAFVLAQRLVELLGERLVELLDDLNDGEPAATASLPLVRAVLADPANAAHFDKIILPQSSNGSALDGPSERILGALASLEAVRICPAPREQVAIFAGYTNLSSKGFANSIGALRTSGHIDYPRPGVIALTARGREAAPVVKRPASNAEFHQRLFEMLGGPEARILRPLIQCYPHAMARDAVAAQAGYGNLSSKGFANSIGRLRSLGLIDYPEPGRVQATSLLFLEGAR